MNTFVINISSREHKFYAPYDYIINNKPNGFSKLKEKIKLTKEDIAYFENRINNPLISANDKRMYQHHLNRSKISLKAYYNQGSYLSAF